MKSVIPNRMETRFRERIDESGEELDGEKSDGWD